MANAAHTSYNNNYGLNPLFGLILFSLRQSIENRFENMNSDFCFTAVNRKRNLLSEGTDF